MTSFEKQEAHLHKNKDERRNSEGHVKHCEHYSYDTGNGRGERYHENNIWHRLHSTPGTGNYKHGTGHNAYNGVNHYRRRINAYGDNELGIWQSEL